MTEKGAFMKEKTVKLLPVALLAAVMLTGCGGPSDIEFADADAAKAALNSAQTIYLQGNYAAIKQKTDILADGKVAAYLKGKTVSVDGEMWFRYDFVTDEPINEDGEDYYTSTTYGYYDADGNCLGYAQMRSIKQEDGDFTRNIYFMDADGNLRPYCIEENGYYAWDDDGNVIATGDWDADFRLSFMDDACHVQIDKVEDAAVQMDFMDIMIMYARLFNEADFWLRD